MTFPKVGLIVAILAIVASIAVAVAATVFKGMATFSFALLCLGLLQRQDRVVHIICMNCGIAIDLLIVLLLELGRDAVATAMGLSLSPLQQAHILSSSLATGLYVPVLALGWMRFRGQYGIKVRTWHVRLGLAAFVFRFLGFCLMFSLD